jgi:hypothetical protein
MTRVLTRTHFHSSRLLRRLTELAAVQAQAPGMAFAERLGLWVDYTDAIALYAVHNASQAAPCAETSAAPSAELGSGCVDIAADFARIRASLEQAISRSAAPKRGQSGFGLPMPGADAPADLGSAFEPYRRYYLAQQRDMDLSVPPLRARVRDALAAAPGALQQLAALDGAFENILSEREARLLATLPQLLKKRFAHLRAQHQQTLVDTQQADRPEQWMQAGAWLARFCHELQTVLLAELDLRLQPAVGLLEALHNEKTLTL